jgi:hypothetical protein
MANPTTNYGFVMPTPTDLVTDLPADFEVFGQAVDTTTKALNPSTTLGDLEYRSATANTNTRLAIGTTGQALTVAGGVPAWAASSTSVLTTTGDTLYASGANTLARLGVGTDGQVLTVAAGVPSWATTVPAQSNWSLLNAGGTALTGAATVTVSGISGQDKIMVLVANASSSSATAGLVSVRINGNTGNNYYPFGPEHRWLSTYAATNYGNSDGFNDDKIPLARLAASAGDTMSGYCILSGCNTSGVKQFTSAGNVGAALAGGYSYISGGYVNVSAAVSSVSIVAGQGNLDAGTVYIYASA